MSNQEDRGAGWIYTYTGRRFWPLDPRPEDVNIVDIAHALALKCRYSGHCSDFYSVAQHSVLVSHAVSPANAKWALLHDAEEAYSPFGDTPRPVKEVLRRVAPVVLDVNARIQAAVCERFGIDPHEPREVKDVDRMILGDEMVRFMADTDGYDAKARWGSLGLTLTPWSWEEAKARFLERFIELREDF